jgi:hypothetical protein
MSLIERRAGQELVRGAERALEVRLGALGGFELRPTRLFLWSGEEREATQRVVSLGREPRSLDIPRREQELRVGGVEVRSLGNPLMTIALAGVHALRRLADETPTEPGSSGRA